jgi:hypothetical protein
MNPDLPFDSIESAHQFVALYAKVVLETKHDIDTDIQREMSSNVSRRLDALLIVAYKLETLELHLTKSRRILNDLRSLRRLLFEERASGALAVRPKSIGIAKAETSPRPSPEVSRSGVSPDNMARQASICATVRKRALSSPRDAHANNVEAADAVPWYTRRTSNLSTRAKSRQMNQALAQQR